MGKQYDVIAYGIDYIRYRIFSDADYQYIGSKLPYLELTERFFHGKRFIDLTGKQLEIIRMLDDIDDVVTLFALLFPVTRIDIFVDVLGNVLDDALTVGTLIYNDGCLETVYSHNLKNRGNLGVFGRVYDAQKAKHYDEPVTRFEVEYKRNDAKTMLNTQGWGVEPIGAMLNDVLKHFGVYIHITDHPHVDFNAPKRRYEHSRTRFYKRYGKNILLDIERMGVQGLYTFVIECMEEKNDDNIKVH